MGIDRKLVCLGEEMPKRTVSALAKMHRYKQGTKALIKRPAA
jgi:hypothetical protein